MEVPSGAFAYRVCGITRSVCQPLHPLLRRERQRVQPPRLRKDDVVSHIDLRPFVTLFPWGGVAPNARARAEWMLGRASISIERRDQKVFLPVVAGALLNMRGNA